MDISKVLTWSGVLSIVFTGLIHIIATPHEFEHAAYVGVLFILNAFGSAAAAYGIYRRRGWGWALGAFIAAGSIIGYVISRTVGLPAAHIERWDALGIVSLAVESWFLLSSAFALAKRDRLKETV